MLMSKAATHVNFARRRVLFTKLEGEVVDVLRDGRRVSAGDDAIAIGLQVLKSVKLKTWNLDLTLLKRAISCFSRMLKKHNMGGNWRFWPIMFLNFEFHDSV